MPDLDVADAPLQEPPRDQDLPRLGPFAVQGPDRGGFLTDVEGVGRLGLHPVGELERLDPRLELGLALAALEVFLVELHQQVELARWAVLETERFLMFSISFSISVCLVSMYVPW